MSAEHRYYEMPGTHISHVFSLSARFLKEKLMDINFIYFLNEFSSIREQLVRYLE